MTKPHTTLSEAVRALELPEPHTGQFEYCKPEEHITRIENGYTADQVRALLSAAADLVEQHEAQEPVELVGVQEQMKEGAGFWHSCSGCHETEDGHPVGSYPYSDVFKCALGNGCSECGGIGAVWDNTDYDAMAVGLESDSAQPTLAATQAGDAQDAARYRWLLENYAFGDGYSDIDSALNDGEADKYLSHAIDAAMSPTTTRSE